MGDVSGRAYCETTVSGVQLRFADARAPGPSSLVIYLHGDGARAYTSDGAMKALLAWADANGARVLAALAPNGCAWWQKPSHVCSATIEERDDAGENAVALDSVFRELKARYDIKNGPVFFYGSSGGTIFLSRWFVPRFGDAYPGAYAMNCGGDAPAKSEFMWDVDSAARRADTRFYFTYGDRDFLADAARASVAAYASFGFATDEKVIAGADHCAFDAHARSAEVFTQYLSAK